jgi:hypothetical protein
MYIFGHLVLRWIQCIEPQIRVRLRSSLTLDLACCTSCNFFPVCLRFASSSWSLSPSNAAGLLLPRWVHFWHEPPLPLSSSSPWVSSPSSLSAFASRPCPMLVAATARSSVGCHCQLLHPAGSALPPSRDCACRHCRFCYDPISDWLDLFLSQSSSTRLRVSGSARLWLCGSATVQWHGFGSVAWLWFGYMTSRL